MSNAQSPIGTGRRRIDTETPRTDTPPQGADDETMLSLMSDDYARDILDALGEQPLCARELVDRMDASRPTVYRRLQRLEDAGVVEGVMTVHPEGHHRKQFRITVDHMHLTFGSDGVSVEVSA